MGKSSSNVANVFKSSLTDHCVHVYLESHMDIYYILQYFLIHCTYSKILNANNEFCCLLKNIYLSEVSTFSYLVSKLPIRHRSTFTNYSYEEMQSSTYFLSHAVLMIKIEMHFSWESALGMANKQQWRLFV